MTRNLVCAAVLVLGATALKADVFSFSYSGVYLGNTVSASGTLTATAVVPGLYTVTALSGIHNGASISADPKKMGGFTYNGSSGVGSFAFLLGLPGQIDYLSFAGGGYLETGKTGMNMGNDFVMSRVPEPTTLSLLLMMGFGVWVLARKVSLKAPPR